MTEGILHPIASIEPRSGYRLLVTWISGDQSTVDFTDDIRRGGIWAALRDETKFEWPEPARSDGSPHIDVDADGLHEMAMRQHEPARLSQLVPAGSGKDRTA
jgi:hypothetical protein